MARKQRPHVLRLRSRFTSDSQRSPTGATTATTTPRSAAFGTVHGWMWPVMRMEPAIVRIDPPTNPSQVFFGLTAGARRCRPTHRPPMSAPTLFRTPAMIAPAKKATPCRLGNWLGASSNAANDPSTPTQTKTKTVEAVYLDRRSLLDPDEIPEHWCRPRGGRP